MLVRRESRLVRDVLIGLIHTATVVQITNNHERVDFVSSFRGSFLLVIMAGSGPAFPLVDLSEFTGPPLTSRLRG